MTVCFDSPRQGHLVGSPRTPSTYLRIVVTRRCWLSCSYCHREAEPIGHAQELQPREFAALCAAGERAVGLKKVKLTGGDPGARSDLAEIASAVTETTDVELSAVTPGVVPASRLEAARCAGLARCNLSVHGWEPAEWAVRGNVPRREHARLDHFHFWKAVGPTPKLNYVYTGPRCHADLLSFLRFARDERALARLLDDLCGEPVSANDLRRVLFSLLGPAARVEPHHAAHALPTERLYWPDGLIVELKTTRLGELAPLVSCATCLARPRCREGIHAWRLTADGRLKPCALRDDLAVDIAGALRSGGVESATSTWRALLERVL